jgi:hypothetical protein
VFGDPASPVRFEEPWSRALDARPVIADRRGCDLEPMDPADPAARRVLLSYIWPDELARFERTRMALELLAADPPRVDRAGAADWLAERLAEAREDDVRTVVWHSVMRQYVPEEEWTRVEALLAGTCELAMEPVGYDQMELRADGRLLATTGDHGPPLRWV